MIVLLFVLLTIIACLTIEHFMRRKAQNEIISESLSQGLSISKISQLLPAGIFLQPSFTWSKMQDNGNLMMGIHPVLMALIGKADRIDTLQEGEKVQKGDIFLKIHVASKILHMKTPIAGSIMAVNPDFSETTWEKLGRTWLYQLEPEEISSEISSWLVAEKSKEWLVKKFQQMTNFFIQSLSQKEMGLTMTDGGELPVGVLSKFEKETWKEFESKFLN